MENRSDLLKKTLKYVNKGKVLELGCGTGENAVYLTLKGFKVTGLDLSKQFIHKCKNLAEIYDVHKNIIFMEKDIVQFEYSEKYDLIISDFVFHFLEKDEIDIVIKNMKENTVVGGLNSVSVFNESNPDRFIHNFIKDELKNYYSGWQVLEYESLKGHDFIIAKKIS